ncbi:MAG TPA: PAS domain-containing protein, partial [Anaerolineae bacterium]|nr:PAS domain-containing protein [Anaerolineae bacterium]
MASITSHLIEPASSLRQIEARLSARLLATLLLALLCLELLGALVISITAYPMNVAWLLEGTAVPLLAAYVLSRTPYYKLGAALSILLFSLLPFVTVTVVAPGLPSDLLFFSLAWLSLPILLTSLFFSTRIAAGYAILVNLSLLLASVLVPRINQAAVNTALGLILTVSTLVVMLMYHHEQTERSRQAALAESEARYRRLAENAQDSIYRYSLVPQPRITYINPVAKDVLGYTPDEFYA